MRGEGPVRADGLEGPHLVLSRGEGIS